MWNQFELICKPRDIKMHCGPSPSSYDDDNFLSTFFVLNFDRNQETTHTKNRSIDRGGRSVLQQRVLTQK